MANDPKRLRRMRAARQIPLPRRGGGFAGLLSQGAVLAQASGIERPSPADAVWALLVEAAEVLKRLPDRERRWLLQSLRSRHPEILHERWEYGAWDRRNPRPGPPAAGAITRMDLTMALLRRLPASRHWRRDIRILWALASNVPPRAVARRVGLRANSVSKFRHKLCAILAEKAGC